MSESKKTKPKRAPDEEPSSIQESLSSPFQFGLFVTKAAEDEAVRLVGNHRLEWAYLDGGAYVKFLTSEGAIFRVNRETGREE